ncbi:Mn2+/Fe2+ NRAMP family transporter [Natronospira proteinivora]|uniref:Mn2+/Fe2+ NRAMP family transporter n=1 Tax=Natronospira proteinivora TaxID=1807133 RepID=A0ABT1G9P1_9GAMM|nr:divalent metal cation transporter [Natronospira proteinivora]MCP1728025.1 Mn2+/Fe2+ NRAMP family transporter [Natronospira proteinivora]
MKADPRQRKALLQTLGPGLLMAGAAVGVSHLVQATRAGAEYGFLLLGLVVLVCALKYPFLEFGPRYAAATGLSLLDGYRRMGRWALGVYILITVGTMFAILASVTVVTAGLAGRFFPLPLGTTAWSAMVLGCCGLILLLGRFRGLDLSMKVIMALLALLTLVAVSLALLSPESWTDRPPEPSMASLWSGAGIAFLLALMGWMPIPLDVAAWHSLWAQERRRHTGHQPSVRHALFDFKLGYVGATLLAVCFLVLGATVMYGSEEALSESGVVFAGQLASLYGQTLGSWSTPVILLGALIVMFSTTLAVSDAYPRVLSALAGFASPKLNHGGRRLFITGFFAVAGGALIVIHFFGQAFTTLVDFATTISFLSAPLLAWLNYRLVTGPLMPAAHRPGPGLRLFSLVGIGFLLGFSLLWIIWRLLG